ncbi:IclR family transcriptional regulator [Tardiphaga sp. OK245]|uniref:IclR family transcriptional regulator n=1 Tax=Tardiphaga sp. OK245 TaxID=1855306 RepID=UPI0008A734F8|nr:IclR family transcriptional regulator [Tardiphaga sp. OK245]SEH46478.1 transcriptional regulator, IclR family [Tardiphaga sp. OK245]
MAKESRGIQSIEVGGELLQALVRNGEPMMLRDLAREAGMSPAKAHPYLASFSRIGLIEQDPSTGRYEFGALALELGIVTLRRLSAVRVATPAITALAGTIDHAVSLAIWGTHGPTVVRMEEPSHPVHIAMRVGSTVSLLETATGRIFAAFMPPATISAALTENLDRLSIGYDPNRKIKGPAIDKILADIRTRGLARAVGEPLRGVNAFSAPVFDHSGEVVLAVTAMGAVGTFDVSWNSPIASALLDCTNAISRRLGRDVKD